MIYSRKVIHVRRDGRELPSIPSAMSRTERMTHILPKLRQLPISQALICAGGVERSYLRVLRISGDLVLASHDVP